MAKAGIAAMKFLPMQKLHSGHFFDSTIVYWEGRDANDC